MDENLKTLRITERVIEVLGGVQAVADLTHCKNLSRASNWKAFKAFPSNTYVIMIEELRKRGFTAPPRLWGMIGVRAKAANRASFRKVSR